MSNDNAEPNIFHFATKELSQDAFLCWLLSWANKNYNQTETKDFYNFAQLFIQKTTGRNDLTLHKISRQEKHIDILLELKDTKGNLYAIVIEDKVFTQEHDQQIERYVKEIKNIASENIYIMYFKTGFTSEQEKRRLTNSYKNIYICGHDEIYCLFEKHPNHYLFNQWFSKFSKDYEQIEEYLKNSDYANVFTNKNECEMACALDKITSNIINNTKFQKSYWYIVDQGHTPHICLYEKYSKNIDGFTIHNAIYLMFRGKSYNISVKQHICELDALTCKDFTGSSGKGIKSRIRIKDYDKLPQNLILTKENMRNSIERATDWQVKRKSDKDNLMIIQKSFLYGEDISHNIIKETPNIEKIIQIIENL